MGRSKKGSSFERRIATMLSMWASKGQSDDWYWRTAGSGGRAKSRSKSGKTTVNSYGDIKAECGKGEFLLDNCVLELKNGYGKFSFLDCLDKQKTRKNEIMQPFEKFYLQVQEDSKNGKKKFPIVIFKRDRRRIVIVIPFDMFKLLPKTKTKRLIKITYDSRLSKSEVRCKVIAVIFEEFLENITPEDFKSCVNAKL